MELLQWKTDDEVRALVTGPTKDPAFVQAIQEELSDILAYTVRLSDVLGIDLGKCAAEKMKKNAVKYPVHLSKGNAKKYTEF